MTCFICETCGVQYAPSHEPPASCRICEDERQYVGLDGQRWTTLDELRATHRNEVVAVEPGLTRIGTEPAFAIGQHCFLVESPAGNVLWDCVTLLDDATVAAVEERGGLAAIAVSHPHYYSTVVEWSRAFGDVPVWLHADDARWITRPDPAIVGWHEETRSLGPGLTLIRGGGHFPGGAMLHWAGGAGGLGALLPGDIIQVVMDRRWVSFMYSYPNLIPLPPARVRAVAATVEPYAFERIYSPWPGRVVERDGAGVVRRSADRYVRAVTAGIDATDPPRASGSTGDGATEQDAIPFEAPDDQDSGA